jgi:predicted DNA-binding transcriptional regulator AlpA
MSSELLTPEQLAEHLQLSPLTLSNWRIAGKGPPYLKLGSRVVRYDLDAVETWLAEQNGQEAREA